MIYYKLKSNLFEISNEKFITILNESRLVERFNLNPTGCSLNYYELNQENFNFFINICPNIIKPDRIQFMVIDGTGKIPPHKDGGTLTALNYYVSCSDEITYFFKESSNNYKYPGKNVNLYNQQDLEIESKIIAQSQETYLLDVSQIHGVEKTDTSPRNVIKFFWKDKNFETILENLKNLGY